MVSEPDPSCIRDKIKETVRRGNHPDAAPTCKREYDRDICASGFGSGDAGGAEVRVDDREPFTADQLIAYYIGIAALVAALVAVGLGVMA